MFDLSKLGDMTRVADQARQLQEKQEKTRKEQTELLRKISGQLDELIMLARQGRG